MMIERYGIEEIKRIWADRNKLEGWQRVEEAILEAKAKLGRIPEELYRGVVEVWSKFEIDLEWWKERDRQIHHDLNAFLDERLRHLFARFQKEVHEPFTSYDTEEPAFGQMMRDSMSLVEQEVEELDKALCSLARQHRYTIMMAKTHGQAAVLQSFGKRTLNWRQGVQVSWKHLHDWSEHALQYSKLSGAVGNYEGPDPEIEKVVLEILGFIPFHGSTQIMHRELYAPIAQGLVQLVQSVEKIAHDIRLGARSENPIYREPFKKKQKGSSAMPHKKNTIRTENLEGMMRLALGSGLSLQLNVRTDEERAIEQSSVERVAWPDLFHIAIRTMRVATKALRNLVVYPENMLLEIARTRGCYASSQAKQFLKQEGTDHGLHAEAVYRIIQLAAFNVHEPNEIMQELRSRDYDSLEVSGDSLRFVQKYTEPVADSIQRIISEGRLRISDELEITDEEVENWNSMLQEMFSDGEVRERWDRIFSPEYLLRNEHVLYEKILNEMEGE